MRPTSAARHRLSTCARRSAVASSGTNVQRLDRLADAGRDLRRRARPGRAARPRGGCAICGASAVPTRSPVPASPIIDSGLRALALGVAPDLGEDVAGGGAGGVEALASRRAGGERGGVLGRRPRSSTPTGSLESSQTTPARMNICWERRRELRRRSRPRRVPRPRGPSRARARARRFTAMRSSPSASARAARRSVPRPVGLARGPWPARATAVRLP